MKRNIKKLKTNKTPASDMMINQYIKCFQQFLSLLYVKQFNKIVDNGVMPSECLVGVIVIRYKNKSDTHDVNNHREITLLGCLSELFTILNDRLTEYSNILVILLM